MAASRLVAFVAAGLLSGSLLGQDPWPEFKVECFPLGGRMEVPFASKVQGGPSNGKSPLAYSKVSIENAAFFVPENRTVLAAVAGIPATREERSMLVILVRAGKSPFRHHTNLGSKLHYFNVQSLLLPGNDPDVHEPIDATFLIELMKEMSGGEEGWGESNSVQYHHGILIVDSFEPSIVRRLEEILALLQTRSHLSAQLSASWLLLDREAASILRGDRTKDQALSKEAVDKLTSWVGDGRARIIDSSGVLSISRRPAVISRGDSWNEWPFGSRAAGGPILDEKDEREETGAALSCIFAGGLGSDDIRLDFKAKVGALVPLASGKFAAISASFEDTFRMKNGASYLLGGGTLLEDGKSGTYLLLQAAWNGVPADLPWKRLDPLPRRLELGPEGLSEVLIPWKEEEKRIKKTFTEKEVTWSEAVPARLESAASRLSDLCGVRVLIDPEFDEGKTASLHVEGVPASSILDMVTPSNFAWMVRGGDVLISRTGKLERLLWDDLEVPSEMDFESPEDREAFHALCREVEMDLSGIQRCSDLFAEIARATKTQYIASSNFLEEAYWIKFRPFPPHGRKVIPVLLLTELRGQIRWSIRNGLILYLYAQ